MNLIIPFEGKVNFDYSVKEICSIALEHEYTINEGSLLGNFLITGTCKEHTLSVNTTDFNFTIPFSVDLPDSVITDSINLEIDNFTYSLDNKTLAINIDYLVTGDEQEKGIREEIILPEEPIFEPVEIEEIVDDTPRKDLEINEPSNLLNFEDDYISYQIHTVTNEDTIESIVKKYNCDEEVIYKLNNITNIMPNDKLIIPIDND